MFLGTGAVKTPGQESQMGFCLGCADCGVLLLLLLLSFSIERMLLCSPG